MFARTLPIRSMVALLAMLCLAGCPQQMIRVAERGTSSAPPVIEMQNLLYDGSAITHPVVSTQTHTSPVSIIVTPQIQPNVGNHVKIQITALAKDTIYGPAYFRIRIERAGKVVTEVVASQSVDANGMTAPTLGIVGKSTVGGSAVSGFKYPIDLWISTNEPVTVTMFAVNFGWLSQTLVMNYLCPTCPPPAPSSPGGGGWPPPGNGGTTTTPGSTAAARSAGEFVIVDPDTRRVGESVTSPDGKVTVTIQSYFGPQPFAAVFKSGAKSYTIPFDISPPGLHPSTFGGAAFTAKSERAVVASFHDNSVGVLDDASFQVMSLATPFTQLPVLMRANFTDPVNGAQSAGVIEPLIMFSPDASLALVLAAPKAGAPLDARSIQVWDLAGTSGQSLYSGNIKEFKSAAVVGTKVVITFADLTTMDVAIP